MAQHGICRRQWPGKLAFTAAPGIGALESPGFLQKLYAAPHSKFGGVLIGVIAPYAFQGMANFQNNGGQNMPWGQGDTPLQAILQLVRKEKWTFPCTIELEYRGEGSNAMAEIARCLQFAEDAPA